MASPQTPVGAAISETARAEGGTSKGSASAQMQSDVVKQRNFEQAAQEIGSKISNAPETITAEDANYLKSREARATGQAQPPSGSLSSDAQHIAAINEGAVSSKSSGGSVDTADQSHRDRIQNFEQAAQAVAPKMADNPEQVTKEDADLLHSREHRAFGATSKGGIASQAQSMASDNDKNGSA